MDVLNDDLIGYILSHLSTKIIGKCLIICKKWKQIIEIYSWMFNLNFGGTTIKDDSIKCCNQITDNGLQHLTGVSVIDLSGCHQITDNKLKYLKGVYTVNLSWCNKINR